jgi:hypothetical protein
MQLVLAIHPDQRQTEQIAVLVRKRLDVEMVQAASAGEGLQELGERIPDLILTAPLLSPFDEDVLAEYLRELGSAAAHVQTLRIPVLSRPSQSSPGIFSFGRKKKAESAPDGCDPQMFVDEMVEYLTRAFEDRRAIAKTAPAFAPPQDQAASPLPTPDDRPIRVPEPAAVDYSYRLDPYPTAQPEPPAIDADTPVYRPDDAPMFESAFPVYEPDRNYAASPEAEPAPREDEPTPAAAVIASPAPPVESAFPIYRSEVVAAPAVSDTVSSAPANYEPSPISFIEAIAEPAAGDVPPSDPTKDEIKDEPFPVYRREHTILELNPQRGDPDRRSTSVSSITPIYQPPHARIEPITQADPLGLHVDHNFDAHASLLLDEPKTDDANRPFVVHSANETVTLSESLERAAAQLEASGLGEPTPAREAERIPMHHLVLLEELPLPEVLSARVTQSVAMGLSAPLPPAVDVDPSLLAEPAAPIVQERTPPVVVESASEPVLIAPAPIVLDATAVEAIVEPAASEAIVEPAAPAAVVHFEPAPAPAVFPESIASPPPADANTPAAAAEPTANGPATRRPSFEAALAAIRKAWGRPRRSTDTTAAVSPKTPDSPAGTELVEPVAAAGSPAPIVGAVVSEDPIPVAALVEDTLSSLEPQEIGDAETRSGREVDLTLDIDALEEHSVAVGQQGPVLLDPEEIDVVARQVDEDVYELSASPALHDLDADLEAAGPPPPVREVFPAAAPPPARPVAKVPSESAAPATRKRDKHRKKSGKNKPGAAQPAAAKPRTDETQPAQDEWGLFDPNRCGFAALVDKLNEVTDEKDAKPAKTSVRVISYG